MINVSDKFFYKELMINNMIEIIQKRMNKSRSLQNQEATFRLIWEHSQ